MQIYISMINDLLLRDKGIVFAREASSVRLLERQSVMAGE